MECFLSISIRDSGHVERQEQQPSVLLKNNYNKQGKIGSRYSAFQHYRCHVVRISCRIQHGGFFLKADFQCCVLVPYVFVQMLNTSVCVNGAPLPITLRRKTRQLLCTRTHVRFIKWVYIKNFPSTFFRCVAISTNGLIIVHIFINKYFKNILQKNFFLILFRKERNLI